MYLTHRPPLNDHMTTETYGTAKFEHKAVQTTNLFVSLRIS